MRSLLWPVAVVLLCTYMAWACSTCPIAAASPRDTVADAIQRTAPGMSRGVAVAYSQAMRDAALGGGFDPLLGVALVWHESGWNAAAESPDGEDIGLAQIRARYVGACRYNDEPVSNPERGCLHEREKLRDGIYNLGLIGDRIKAWRKLCRTKTGHSAPRHWLAGLGGYDRLKPGTSCGQHLDKRGRWSDSPTPRAVSVVLACHQCLLKPQCKCSRKPQRTKPRSTGARSGSRRGK